MDKQCDMVNVYLMQRIYMFNAYISLTSFKF